MTAAVVGSLVLGRMAKVCQKHFVAVLELQVAQMPHLAAQVLMLARRRALMAGRTLMPADLVLMVVQRLTPADLALMAGRMLCSDPVPMVVRKLESDLVPRVARKLDSVERVLKAGQKLAAVADPSQKAAQKRCFVADRKLTVGQTLKLDRMLDALAVHFVRKATAVLDH